jgi:hypothetical protein
MAPYPAPFSLTGVTAMDTEVAAGLGGTRRVSPPRRRAAAAPKRESVGRRGLSGDKSSAQTSGAPPGEVGAGRAWWRLQ